MPKIIEKKALLFDPTQLPVTVSVLVPQQPAGQIVAVRVEDAPSGMKSLSMWFLEDVTAAATEDREFSVYADNMQIPDGYVKFIGTFRTGNVQAYSDFHVFETTPAPSGA